MHAKPLVSVIIPCFNQGHYLSETIDSVIAQTYENWECIIVDDGSSDQTKSIAQHYANNDSRIKYFYQNNQGLSSARNSGLKEAQGDFIQFLDADDLIHKNKFRDQLSEFRDYPGIDVSYSDYNTFYDSPVHFKGKYSHLSLGEKPLEDFLFKWERGLSIPIHSALFRKSIFNGDDSVFHPSLRAKEDWVMWVKLAVRDRKFKFLDKTYAYYRKHESSITKDNYTMGIYFYIATGIIAQIIPLSYLIPFIVASETHKMSLYKMPAHNKCDILYSKYCNFSSYLNVDTGFGFDETKLIRNVLLFNANNSFITTFDLSGFTKIHSLLFYPIKGLLCKLKIHSIILRQGGEKEKRICFHKTKNDIATNGIYDLGNWIFFDVTEPHVILPFGGEFDSISIEGELCIIDFDQLIQHKNQVIASMHNSFSWKIGRLITWLPRMILKVIMRQQV